MIGHSCRTISNKAQLRIIVVMPRSQKTDIAPFPFPFDASRNILAVSDFTHYVGIHDKGEEDEIE
jgi:hypothetical protein